MFLATGEIIIAFVFIAAGKWVMTNFNAVNESNIVNFRGNCKGAR